MDNFATVQEAVDAFAKEEFVVVTDFIPGTDNNPELIMIGSVQDVTERMRLQQVKDDFISTVSHELRTPLTSITAALKLILSTQADSLNVTTQKLVNIAFSNGTRLHHLINDLLDVEKLAAGKMSFDIKQQPILPIIEKALADHAAYADKLAISLELRMDDFASNVSIRVDEHRLQQILANLLSNAMKYSAPESAVTIEVGMNGQWLEVAINASQRTHGCAATALFDNATAQSKADFCVLASHCGWAAQRVKRAYCRHPPIGRFMWHLWSDRAG